MAISMFHTYKEGSKETYIKSKKKLLNIFADINNKEKEKKLNRNIEILFCVANLRNYQENTQRLLIKR